VLDARDFTEKTRINVPGGPGMQIFSPDGRYAYVCSSFNPQTVVITVEDRQIVGSVAQASPFCPNIAATPDGKQVWLTLKDVGKTMIFDAQPPFTVLKTIDTGPITNHVNFAKNSKGLFAYISVGGLNVVKVFRVSDASLIATVPVGKLPHGIWPSGDGKRIYVGMENGDSLTAIDTLTNKVIADVPIGQAPQAINYVPDAVPQGSGTDGLQPLGVAGEAAHLALAPPQERGISESAPTSVALFDQGLLQVLQASATGLQPRSPYVLALSSQPDGSGGLEPLASFVTNSAGAAIVNAIGPIRQIVEVKSPASRRYLVIAAGTAAHPGGVIQIERP
jgi:YVTN family beta-propeller protein